MWNRGLEDLLREENVCWEDSPSFLAILLPLSVRNIKLNKQTKDRARLLPFPTSFGKRRFKPRDPSEGLLRFWIRRGVSVESWLVAPTRVPAAARQQTPSGALPSTNWSCEFEQKGNYVSWRKPEAEFKSWRGFPSGTACFLKFVTPCSETAPVEALGAVWKSSTTIWQRAAKLWAAY